MLNTVNINVPECFNISSNSSFSLETIATDSLLSKDIIKSFNISENSPSFDKNNNIELDENSLDNYYENFYN